MRAAFESAGDIRSVDLLAALASLWRERAGGSLRFSRPGATAGFDLLDGEVVLSLSSQPHFDTAAILMRAGKLDAAALEKLQRPPGEDPSLGPLQAGLISLKEWRWGQKIRAIEILSDLLGWLEGEYSFDPAAVPPGGDWRLSVPRLILELFLRSRDRTLVEHYLGPSDLPLLRSGRFDEEFATFGLTSDAGAVVALIDGSASAEEIAERAPAEEFAVLKLLAALTTLGLVHPAEAAPEPEGVIAPPIPPQATAPEAVPEEPRAEPEPAPGPPAEEEPGSPEAEARDGEQIAEPTAEPAAEPTPEPVAEPAESESRVPADMLPDVVPTEIPLEIVEPPVPAPPAHREEFEREFPASPAGGLPPAPANRSGALLAGLLAALIVAVAVLVIVRSRGISRPQTAVTDLRPTAQENPVFPPAETAVPLPPRGARGEHPSPVVTRPAAISQTLAPTVASTVAATRVPTSPPPTKPRGPTSPPPTRPPTQVPTRPPTRAEPTKPPTPVPTRPQPTRPPSKIPTRLPTPVPPTAAARGETTRATWIARAERDREALSKRRNAPYTIQLELACEIETLEKAWNWDRPAGTMWLLTTSYRGRTCFRVMWGRFASLAEARQAKSRVPEFFVAPGNRPTVVSVR